MVCRRQIARELRTWCRMAEHVDVLMQIAAERNVRANLTVRPCSYLLRRAIKTLRSVASQQLPWWRRSRGTAGFRQWPPDFDDVLRETQALIDAFSVVDDHALLHTLHKCSRTTLALLKILQDYLDSKRPLAPRDRNAFIHGVTRAGEMTSAATVVMTNSAEVMANNLGLTIACSRGRICAKPVDLVKRQEE